MGEYNELNDASFSYEDNHVLFDEIAKPNTAENINYMAQ